MANNFSLSPIQSGVIKLYLFIWFINRQDVINSKSQALLKRPRASNRFYTLFIIKVHITSVGQTRHYIIVTRHMLHQYTWMYGLCTKTSPLNRSSLYWSGGSNNYGSKSSRLCTRTNPSTIWQYFALITPLRLVMILSKYIIMMFKIRQSVFTFWK